EFAATPVLSRRKSSCPCREQRVTAKSSGDGNPSYPAALLPDPPGLHRLPSPTPPVAAVRWGPGRQRDSRSPAPARSPDNRAAAAGYGGNPPPDADRCDRSADGPCGFQGADYPRGAGSAESGSGY